VASQIGTSTFTADADYNRLGGEQENRMVTGALTDPSRAATTAAEATAAPPLAAD
jgi:hypothetical protein